MKITSLHRTVVAAAVLAMTAFPVLAQCEDLVPSISSLMNLQIYKDGMGPIGDNIVSIPAWGPLSLGRTTVNNGFKQLCDMFGLTGTTTTIIQLNGQAGTVTAFICNQAAPPTWTLCQAALVRPAANATGIIPGIEGSWIYTSWVEGGGAMGDNLFPVPVTIVSNSPQDLCSMLNLPPSSQVIQFLAGVGTINTHLCGATPTWALRLGEGVLIRPTGTARGRAVIF